MSERSIDQPHKTSDARLIGPISADHILTGMFTLKCVASLMDVAQFLFHWVSHPFSMISTQTITSSTSGVTYAPDKQCRQDTHNGGSICLPTYLPIYLSIHSRIVQSSVLLFLLALNTTLMKLISGYFSVRMLGKLITHRSVYTRLFLLQKRCLTWRARNELVFLSYIFGAPWVRTPQWR